MVCLDWHTFFSVAWRLGTVPVELQTMGEIFFYIKGYWLHSAFPGKGFFQKAQIVGPPIQEGQCKFCPEFASTLDANSVKQVFQWVSDSPTPSNPIGKCPNGQPQNCISVFLVCKVVPLASFYNSIVLNVKWPGMEVSTSKSKAMVLCSKMMEFEYLRILFIGDF